MFSTGRLKIEGLVYEKKKGRDTQMQAHYWSPVSATREYVKEALGA